MNYDEPYRKVKRHLLMTSSLCCPAAQVAKRLGLSLAQTKNILDELVRENYAETGREEELVCDEVADFWRECEIDYYWYRSSILDCSIKQEQP